MMADWISFNHKILIMAKKKNVRCAPTGAIEGILK